MVNSPPISRDLSNNESKLLFQNMINQRDFHPEAIFITNTFRKLSNKRNTTHFVTYRCETMAFLTSKNLQFFSVAVQILTIPE